MADEYKAWRVMASSEALICYSGEFDTSAKALQNYFDENTITLEDMYEKGHVLNHYTTSNDERFDDEIYSELHESYSVAEMLEISELREVIEKNFNAEEIKGFVEFLENEGVLDRSDSEPELS